MLGHVYNTKEALISALIIQPSDWNEPFEMMCDASDYAIGAVLGQRKDKKLHAIYYASRTLDHAQTNYAITKKELLVLYPKICPPIFSNKLPSQATKFPKNCTMQRPPYSQN